MSDIFLLLIAPAGGDELQGVKRGIMEIADLILVNKADGDLKAAAARTCADYAGALRLLRKRPQDPPGYPRAMMVSAIEGTGLETAWAAIRDLADWRKANGHWDATRAAQARGWFVEEVRHALLARLETPRAIADLAELSDKVADGSISEIAAAREMLKLVGVPVQGTGPEDGEGSDGNGAMN